MSQDHLQVLEQRRTAGDPKPRDRGSELSRNKNHEPFCRRGPFKMAGSPFDVPKKKKKITKKDKTTPTNSGPEKEENTPCFCF